MFLCFAYVTAIHEGLVYFATTAIKMAEYCENNNNALMTSCQVQLGVLCCCCFFNILQKERRCVDRGSHGKSYA